MTRVRPLAALGGRLPHLRCLRTSGIERSPNRSRIGLKASEPTAGGSARRGDDDAEREKREAAHEPLADYPRVAPRGLQPLEHDRDRASEGLSLGARRNPPRTHGLSADEPPRLRSKRALPDSTGADHASRLEGRACVGAHGLESQRERADRRSASPGSTRTSNVECGRSDLDLVRPMPPVNPPGATSRFAFVKSSAPSSRRRRSPRSRRRRSRDVFVFPSSAALIVIVGLRGPGRRRSSAWPVDRRSGG